MNEKKNAKKVADIKFARGDYEDVIRQIINEGKCPFCPDNLKYHKKPILKKIGHWFITESQWPYDNSERHFMIIGDEHKEHILELLLQDFQDILELTKWVCEEYNMPAGALCMRFGETEYTGSTVCHIHAQLILPVKGKTIYFPIG